MLSLLHSLLRPLAEQPFSTQFSKSAAVDVVRKNRYLQTHVSPRRNMRIHLAATLHFPNPHKAAKNPALDCAVTITSKPFPRKLLNLRAWRGVIRTFFHVSTCQARANASSEQFVNCLGLRTGSAVLFSKAWVGMFFSECWALCSRAIHLPSAPSECTAHPFHSTIEGFMLAAV